MRVSLKQPNEVKRLNTIVFTLVPESCENLEDLHDDLEPFIPCQTLARSHALIRGHRI